MKRFSLSAVLFVAACSVLPQARPVRYRTLVLDVEPASAPEWAGRRTAAIALRDVELPSYLDGDRVVTRAGDHEIRYARDERWGEPLAAAVPRILAADLEGRLAGDGVELRPAGGAADAWVDVSLQRFEADERGGAELCARWTIYARHGGLVKSGAARLVDGGSGSAAASLSRLLGALGEAIAADLRADVVAVSGSNQP